MTTFKTFELVDEYSYQKLGDQAINLLDNRIIETIDKLKEVYKAIMIINTYGFENWRFWGVNKFKDRGYRSEVSKTGAKGGAHFRGLAMDIDFYDQKGFMIPADQVRKWIIDNLVMYPHLRAIETGVNWVHIDCMGEEDHPKRVGFKKNVVGLITPDNRISFIRRP